MSTIHYRPVPRIVARATMPNWRRLSLIEILRAWFTRLRDRRDLAELSDGQLHDVGLSRDLVKREANKPFWIA